ncbi:MAG: TerC family protein [Deltaproteobacteria bacterium]|nr:TerC family protein [Deltaproteobacteria bacterium]
MKVLALWGFFAGLIVGTLMVDILRYMKKPHALSLREAAVWTGTWVGLAAMFGGAIFAVEGTTKGLEFITGYIVEWSLSVDNLFVFLMIFQYFAVPPMYQQRVLFYGILGAIIMRGIFIATAVTLLSYFAWLVYVFGAFLIYVAFKLVRAGEVHVEPQKNPVLRFFKRIVPVETTYDSQNFFVRRKGKLMATALMPVMIVIATTDLMFAVDSIPAILAITRDPFIVYTSNIYALLGLRALFFVLAGVMGMFRFLQVGLCVVLMFIGVKMLISEFVHIHIAISLGVVVTVLVASVVASILFPAEKAPAPDKVDEGLAAPTRPAGEDAGKDEEEKRAA